MSEVVIHPGLVSGICVGEAVRPVYHNSSSRKQDVAAFKESSSRKMGKVQIIRYTDKIISQHSQCQEESRYERGNA